MNEALIVAAFVPTLLIGSLAYSAPTSAEPVKSAISWLEAVRDKDPARLVQLTHFPFTTAGDVTAKSKGCKGKRSAPASTKFAPVAQCIIDNQLFRESIPPDTSALIAADWKTVSLSAIPKSIQKYKQTLERLAPGSTFVAGSLPGDGISYDVVAAVQPDGTVAAVVADGEAVE